MAPPEESRVPLAEGWYLMNTREVEQLLAALRDPSARSLDPGYKPLSIADALSYRNAGNLADDEGRTLRLVLHVRNRAELLALDEKRLQFEPDFHGAPTWRRTGSHPVNVVPLRIGSSEAAGEEPWWEDPDVGALEREWGETGRVAGIAVPAEVRGFVFKTVLALQRAGAEVSIESVAASIRRWLSKEDADYVESRLRAAAPGGSA